KVNGIDKVAPRIDVEHRQLSVVVEHSLPLRTLHLRIGRTTSKSETQGVSQGAGRKRVERVGEHLCGLSIPRAQVRTKQKLETARVVELAGAPKTAVRGIVLGA